MYSTALSSSPSDAARASLQSIIETPVFLRSSLTAPAVIWAIVCLLQCEFRPSFQDWRRARAVRHAKSELLNTKHATNPKSEGRNVPNIANHLIRLSVIRISFGLGEGHRREAVVSFEFPPSRRLCRLQFLVLVRHRLWLFLVLATGRGGRLRTDQNCLGQVPHDQLNRANAVVVAGDGQIDQIGVAVGVDQGDGGNPQRPRFF